MFKCSLAKLNMLAVLLSGVVSAEAGVAVVVNPSVSASGDVGDVARLFLGKSADLGGVSLKPIDQEEGAPAREEFYQKAAQKSAAQLNAYWSRIIFTGKGQPPKTVLDDEEVKEYVAKDPTAIGYIDSGAVDSSVKVVVVVE